MQLNALVFPNEKLKWKFFFFKSKKLPNSEKYGLALLQIFILEIKTLKVKLHLQSMLINKQKHYLLTL